MRQADQRSHPGAVVERVPDRDGPGPPDHLLQELREDLLLDEHPGAVATHLAHVEAV